MVETEVVYSTETGKKPRGGHTQTAAATTPLPPPVKRIAKKTTKKRKPRVRAKTEPLTHLQWPKKQWAEAQAACRPGEMLVVISATEARTVYTS